MCMSPNGKTENEINYILSSRKQLIRVVIQNIGMNEEKKIVYKEATKN